MPPERPTDHMPPVRKPEPSYQREPDLLTHRDDDYLMDQEVEAYDDGRDEAVTPGEYKRGRRRMIWRWVRRAAYVFIFLSVTVPIAAFYIIYQNVTVPDPKTVAFGEAQPVTIYYADGSVMDKITTNARTFITADQIPDNVRHAVEAAEDETFETNNGFDVAAIIRSGLNQVTGVGGGGSTITQEYIKKATGNEQHTLTRKITEAAEAYKMTQTYKNKNDILAAYLNIVYFGRGAYGIESAAQAYYGVHAAQLTPEQAALIAGMIQLPSDSGNMQYEHERWTYVWGRMDANHWVTDAQYKAGQFPTPTAAQSGNKTLSWDDQLIENQVIAELANDGWSEEQLKAQGAQIYTTIQPAAQQAAENSIKNTLQPDAALTAGNTPMTKGGEQVTDDGVGRTPTKTNPVVKNTETAALVSINPTNGEIMAYYGGNNPNNTQLDMASSPHQAGSSFKPYVLAAGLIKNPGQIGLNSVYDPTSGQVFDGTKINNADGDNCPAPCTVQKAMTASINTVFYKMGTQVGTPAVRDAAYDAGVSKTQKDYLGRTIPALEEYNHTTLQPTGQVLGGIAIGQYPVSVRDQAQGYATFANSGMMIPSHFVRKVTDISGQHVLYQFNTGAKQAFSSDPTTNQQIAKTVADSMSQVAGSNGFGLSNGRPADAKTGTQNFVPQDQVNNNWNSDGWTVGFTPSVVTAVWFGHYDQPGPIFGNGNGGSGSNYPIFGRTEPGHIWMNFMNSYLNNQPVQQFPTSPADIMGNYDFTTGMPISQETQNNNPTSQPNQPGQPTQTTDPGFPSFTLPTDPGGGHHHPTTTDTPTTTQCNPVLPGCQGGNPGGGGGLPGG